MKATLFFVILFIVISLCSFIYGYEFGKLTKQAEVEHEVIKLQKEIESKSKQISQLVKSEKEKLAKIKMEDMDCEKVLNFNLRHCIK